MKVKWNLLLPILLMVVFAATRYPGLLPLNFSAAYALAFCAGVYFPVRLAWWLPLVTLAVTDLLLNTYYYFVLHIDAFQAYQLINYAVYALLIGMGRRFNSRDSLAKLAGGGILGAILFYLVTNTAAWFFNPFNNPEYTKSIAGWVIALTKGTAGYAPTWEFFRNTLLSGGLFTALFAGAMKLSEAAEREPQNEAVEDKDGEEAPVPSAASEPEQGRAQTG